MLDPSSSEEEGEEVQEVKRKEAVAPKSIPGVRMSPGRAAETQGGGGGGPQPRGRGGSGSGRPSSPSPSVGSDKEKEDLEKLQREEEERKKRLQLYVFVMRCIAYPFNAKQPTDMARRQQKVGFLRSHQNRYQLLLHVNIVFIRGTSPLSQQQGQTIAACLYAHVYLNTKYLYYKHYTAIV